LNETALSDYCALETPEYERMDRAEDHLWWYRSLHTYLIDALQNSTAPIGVNDGVPSSVPNSAAVLDAGCGSGGLLRALAQANPPSVRIGLERFEPAATRARAKSDAAIVVGTVNALPFEDRSFGTIICADVLYHRDVDPPRALRESLRCLLPGGVLLINVPAFQWLSSYHDQRVHGARRFSRQQLSQLLQDAGFTRIAMHYWNSLLRPARADTVSDVGALPPALNAILTAIVALERRMIRLGLRFPAGGSILAVARKP
jgi:SAM-dependent methyltransferase